MARVAAQIGTPLMPWQQHVADVAFELEADGQLAYSKIGMVVGRQEGKTALKFVTALHRLLVMVETHGPQLVTYTMQDRKKARTRLERDYAARLRRSRGFKEIPASSRQRPTKRTEWRLGMNSGVEHIQFGPSSYLTIDTPSRTGGHGDTLNLGLIDEAFAHADDTVETGMEPALLVPEDTQLWVMSAAGDARSVYLYREVLSGRKLVEEGVDAGAAYFEWSAEDDSEPGDPSTWERACPALGIVHADGSGITVEKLAARWLAAQRKGTEGIDLFRRSYLCQWPEVPVLEDSAAHRVIPLDAWLDCERVGHRPTGTLAYALDVDSSAAGEEWASIAASDGTHVEVVTPPDSGPGTGWVVEACKARRERFSELIVDPSGPAGRLISELDQAGISVRAVKAAEFAQASAQFLDAVTARAVRHIDQPRLNAAIAGADRRDVGDGAWKWSRKRSHADIGPLVAASLARWAAVQHLDREIDFLVV